MDGEQMAVERRVGRNGRPVLGDCDSWSKGEGHETRNVDVPPHWLLRRIRNNGEGHRRREGAATSSRGDGHAVGRKHVIGARRAGRRDCKAPRAAVGRDEGWRDGRERQRARVRSLRHRQGLTTEPEYEISRCARIVLEKSQRNRYWTCAAQRRRKADPRRNLRNRRHVGEEDPLKRPLTIARRGKHVDRDWITGRCTRSRNTQCRRAEPCDAARLRDRDVARERHQPERSDAGERYGPKHCAHNEAP